MKTRFPYLLFLPFVLLLAGCPVSTNFPLAEKGSAKADKKLIGTWTNAEQDPAVKTVTLEAGAERNTYNIYVRERGSVYGAETDTLTGWLAEVGGRTFLVAREMRAGEALYFQYHLTIEKDRIVTHDARMLEGGMDAVTSTEAFQKEILASMKHDDFLTEPTEWTRVK